MYSYRSVRIARLIRLAAIYPHFFLTSRTKERLGQIGCGAYQDDGFGRLTWAQRGTTTALTYGYDGLGNMTGGNGASYQYGITLRPHWLTNASPWGSVSHDANGALTDVPETDTGPRRTMSFDREGRLEQVNTWDDNTIRYLYDFRGERVARVLQIE